MTLAINSLHACLRFTFANKTQAQEKDDGLPTKDKGKQRESQLK